MVDCTFELNGQPMSTLKVGAATFSALSGRNSHLNKRQSACLAELGPIPPGTYYILDRQTGGRLGPLLDRIKDRLDWFALYADDGRVDDEIFCNQIKRGQFRLHPKGPSGRSDGCILIDDRRDFYRLRALLSCHRAHPVPGSNLVAYGNVVVR
ncbi:hypothetical protein CJO94_06680 [Ralstonia solanacearum]|nr:hypothetical protein CJO94_06680 [Ralstonia solanacearum]